MAADFSVAQLIEPSDGLVTSGSKYLVPDWPRGLIYVVNNNYIRTYTTEKATQSPLRSVACAVFIYATPGLDPLSGDILILGNPAGTSGPSNAMPIFRLSPITGAVTSTYGGMSSLGSYPNGVWVPESLVGVICNSVSYAVSKENAFSGSVCVHRADPALIHAGHDHTIVSNNRDSRANMTPGAQGAGGASAFLIDTNNPGQTTANVYYVRIAPGAETYNPATWPITNPYITSGTLATVAATDMNPAWTQIVGAFVAYDQTDGNVIAGFIDASHINPERIAKINATTGAIMWVTEVQVHAQNKQASRLADGYLWLAGGNLNVSTVVNTATGAPTVTPLTGLNFNEPSVVSDGGSLVAFRGSYATGGAPGAGTTPADPAPGTPNSFSGYGLLWPTVPLPPLGGGGDGGPKTFTDAELLFSDTGGFYDFTNPDVRRLFVTANGTPQWMSPDGSIPFSGHVPEVYLSEIGGDPANFAVNEGSGGAFAIISGPLTLADGPGCTPYYLTAAAGPASEPVWRLSVSDDGSRTWSTLVKPREIGKTGEYKKRLRWLKMGHFRQRSVKLECTDPVRRNIIGIYEDLEQGMS